MEKGGLGSNKPTVARERRLWVIGSVAHSRKGEGVCGESIKMRLRRLEERPWSACQFIPVRKFPMGTTGNTIISQINHKLNLSR